MKTMKADWILTLLVVFVVAAATAYSTAQTEARAQQAAPGESLAASSSMPVHEPQFQSRDRRYEIEPGDSFDITFDLTPEFNQTGIAVQPDGFVTLHGIGDIKVQGQTVPELTSTLRQAYSKIL